MNHAIFILFTLINFKLNGNLFCSHIHYGIGYLDIDKSVVVIKRFYAKHIIVKFCFVEFSRRCYK